MYGKNARSNTQPRPCCGYVERKLWTATTTGTAGRDNVGQPDE